MVCHLLAGSIQLYESVAGGKIECVRVFFFVLPTNWLTPCMYNTCASLLIPVMRPHSFPPPQSITFFIAHRSSPQAGAVGLGQ